jgi:conjugative transfer signal peptidase TraF
MNGAGQDGRDLPLMAWGDELRRRKIARRRLRLRSASIAAFSVIAMSPAWLAPTPLLLWNASASAPIGLYWIGSARHLRHTDLVVARLSADAARLAAVRGYLPRGLPVVKHVAAMSGDRICGASALITINGKPTARRHATDRLSRPLPAWLGCMTLREDQVLLLNAHVADSYDGRYFGPTRRHDILGRAHPLWRR